MRARLLVVEIALKTNDAIDLQVLAVAVRAVGAQTDSLIRRPESRDS